MTPLDLVRQACPIINDTGWAYYFTPETQGKGAELGLKGPMFYFAGRGGVLGDCDADVVTAAFGYFNPAVIRRAWESATSIRPAREIGRAHFECCADLGRQKLGGVANLTAFVEAADAVNRAAEPDGLALYAAFKAEPLAQDLAGRAMQLVAVLREFRGSAHLIAVRASGLTTKQAHFSKRPNDVAMFGWTPEDAPVLDDDVANKMKAAEDLTDQIVLPAFSVLDDAGARALLDGARAIKAAVSS
ncbi:MAG: SCO6745 family protein [Ilumatobacteraceae bacterium]